MTANLRPNMHRHCARRSTRAQREALLRPTRPYAGRSHDALGCQLRRLTRKQALDRLATHPMKIVFERSTKAEHSIAVQEAFKSKRQ